LRLSIWNVIVKTGVWSELGTGQDYVGRAASELNPSGRSPWPVSKQLV
jgi:hypothetical protein